MPSKKQPANPAEGKDKSTSDAFCEAFAREYADNGHNATRAYQTLKPATEYRNARNMGTKLTKDPRVAEYIRKYDTANFNARQAEREEVIQVLLAIATAKAADLYIEDPDTGDTRRRKVTELNARLQHAVQEFSEDTDTRVARIKLYNKLEAIKQLAAMCGWNSPQELNVRGGLVAGLRFGFDKEE